MRRIPSFRLFFFILLTFIVAWILMLIPIHSGWKWIRPNWVTLVLIYWVFTLPQYMGVMIAWCIGLTTDILGAEILGQYALSCVVVAYLARLFRKRIRTFLSWQEVLILCVLVGFGDLVLLLVQWLVGHPPQTLLYWAPTLSSALIWPFGYRLLKSLENRIVG